MNIENTLDNNIDLLGMEEDTITTTSNFFMVNMVLANNPNHSLLFFCITHYMKDDNSVELKVSELAKDLILAETTIYNTISYFIKNKLIMKSKKPNIYYVNSQLLPPADGVSDYFNEEIPVGFNFTKKGLSKIEFERPKKKRRRR